MLARLILFREDANRFWTRVTTLGMLESSLPQNPGTSNDATMNPKLLALFMPPMWGGVGLIIFGATTGNDNLIGIGVGIFVVTFIAALVLKISKADSAHKALGELWRTGTPAKAKILNIQTNGSGMNDNPRIQFDLEIVVEGRAPYKLHTDFMVSKIRLPAIQPGEEIEVRVDPNDPNSIAPDETLIYPPYRY